MLRLQRVTFLALNQFLGLGYELIKQVSTWVLYLLINISSSSSSSFRGFRCQLISTFVNWSWSTLSMWPSTQLMPLHPIIRLLNPFLTTQTASEEGGVGSGERASVRRDSVDHHDSTGSSDEINKKGKSVAIDISQNEQFTHRLLPSQSPEFDNVINQVNYKNRQTDRQTHRQAPIWQSKNLF